MMYTLILCKTIVTAERVKLARVEIVFFFFFVNLIRVSLPHHNDSPSALLWYFIIFSFSLLGGWPTTTGVPAAKRAEVE